MLQNFTLILLDSFSEKLPNHGNRDSHVNTFPLLYQAVGQAGLATKGNLPPAERALIARAPGASHAPRKLSLFCLPT